jgi:Icc-related predicted phosphoesterase
LYRKYFGATHYKFSIGKTLFVSMDNATDGVFEDEYKWVEGVLKAERDKYRDLIVFMHIPPYDMRGGDQWHAMPAEKGRKLLALLKEYRTTAIFAGHIHGYEAWNKDDIPLWVSGGAGAELVEGGFYNYLEVTIRDGKLDVKMHQVK